MVRTRTPSQVTWLRMGIGETQFENDHAKSKLKTLEVIGLGSFTSSFYAGQAL